MRIACRPSSTSHAIHPWQSTWLVVLVLLGAHQLISHSYSHVQKHVIIATDTFYPEIVASGTPAQVRAYKAAIASQLALLHGPTGRDMLAEAFKNLPNLETIDIRDFNSNTRNRDGTRWRSYGAPTMERTINRAMDIGTSTQTQFIKQIYTVTLAALAAAEVRPPNLEIVLRSPGWGLPDSSMYIPRWLEPSMAPVLAGLKKLHLTLAFDSNSDRLFQARSENAEAISSSFTRKFLTYTPNVTWLRINFRMHDPMNMDRVGPSPNERFLDWLATPAEDTSPLSYDDPKPVALAALENLELGVLDVNYRSIWPLVQKFAPSLRALTFWKVTLTVRNDKHIAEGWSPNLWASVFSRLSEATQKGELSLRDLHVGHLRQSYPVAGHPGFGPSHVVSFADSHAKTRSAVRAYSDSLQSMESFLDSLVNDGEVNAPFTMSRAGSGMNSPLNNALQDLIGALAVDDEDDEDESNSDESEEDEGDSNESEEDELMSNEGDADN